MDADLSGAGQRVEGGARPAVSRCERSGYLDSLKCESNRELQDAGKTVGANLL